MNNRAQRACVLYSGGLDSSSLLNMVMKLKYKETLAIIIDYGQGHRKEIEYAVAFCEKRGINYRVLDITGIIDAAQFFTDVEHAAYRDIVGTPSTWVPNRNNLFVHIAVAIGTADKENVDIFIATHEGDNMYPDTTSLWLDTVRENVLLATQGKAHICAPFWDSSKAELIKMGGLTREEVDETWSCYRGGDEHCHDCATCIERDEAIKIVFGE